MKATCTIATKEAFSNIKVEVEGNSKEIVDKYIEVSLEYWNRFKKTEQVIATKVTNDEANNLAKQIDQATSIEALESLSDSIKKIDGVKVQAVIMKKYNDKMIKLND